MSEVNAPNCGRENDLIGYLYGELNEVEALAFQRHFRECVKCSTELASFGHVRESVVAWRNESIGNCGLPVQGEASSPTRLAPATPSAIAALREFFNLSPLWMKGAVAFAAVLFCVFAGLALARMGSKPPVASVPTQVVPVHSPQEVNALVDRRVQEELKRIRNAPEQSSNSLLANDKASPEKLFKRGVSHRNALAANPGQSARRPLSKTEREQLAADLRLVTAKSDDVELLEDRINQ